MNQLFTRWGKEINPTNLLMEYPRPQLQRDSYLNLNGYWDFAVSRVKEYPKYDGEILVPFSPESILSGVNHITLPDEYLFYHKEVILPPGFKKKFLFLHFGAVDQISEIFINGKKIYEHIGGFIPFSLDITPYVLKDSFDLKLRVKDLTNTSYHQTGKQRLKRGGIFYTPQSGIWQTVWLESVEECFLRDIKLTPVFDENVIHIECDFNGFEKGDTFDVVITHEGEDVISLKSYRTTLDITLPKLYPWTPETPHLYDIEIIYKNDRIKSYFGMRKFFKDFDDHGIPRFYLNNEPYFLNGLLDQGYYPDGLLTNPSDEALIYDISEMKKMGFNLLRKHIKIEPLRFYYHCDRLGMMVWQDMISGSEKTDIFTLGLLATLHISLKDHHYRLFGRSSEIGRNQFIIELKLMLQHLKNVVSISTWVPFNESWGQFDSAQVTDMIYHIDPTRFVDSASGWMDQGAGDYFSKHLYFTKIKMKPKKKDKRMIALTEFGGYSYMIPQHSYDPKHSFGYRMYKSQEDLENAIYKLYEEDILNEVQKGLSVLVYTQVSDVEDEVNGYFTYDRETLKVNPERMKEISVKLKEEFLKSL